MSLFRQLLDTFKSKPQRSRDFERDAEKYFANSSNWTSVHSSWCQRIAWFAYYDYPNAGLLRVLTRDGVTLEYPNINKAVWDLFLSASSKGKFAHRYLWTREYRVV